MKQLSGLAAFLTSACILVWFSLELISTPVTLGYLYSWARTTASQLSVPQRDALAQETRAILQWNAFNQESVGAELKQLRFGSGVRVFTDLEVDHLLDVHARFWWVRAIGLVCLAIHLAVIRKIGFVLYRRWILSGLTIVLFVEGLVALLLMFFWERLFIGFHQILFPGGNWSFPANSSLIQLFPESFWFMTAVLFVAILLILTASSVFVSWWQTRIR